MTQRTEAEEGPFISIHSLTPILYQFLMVLFSTEGLSIRVSGGVIWFLEIKRKVFRFLKCVVPCFNNVGSLRGVKTCV